MLDVLHYMFEEDLQAESSEHAEAKSQLRTTLYDTMYDRRYKYALQSTGSSTGSFDFDTDDGFVNNPESGVIPFDPTKHLEVTAKPETTKPKRYVPPTDFNSDMTLPFGKILDSPMN